MSTNLLVLGGSGFVGRAVVSEGLRRGWNVSTFNRGRRPPIHAGELRMSGDRLDAATLAPLGNRDWDLVVDTWSGAPRAVSDSAAVLAGRTAHYVYVSSGSVYAPPLPTGVEETAPTVEGSPDAEDGDYPALKRGAELAVTRAFGDRALLEACQAAAGAPDARMTWLDSDAVLAAGIEPWTELPIWLPRDSEFAGMHSANVERARQRTRACHPGRLARPNALEPGRQTRRRTAPVSGGS